MTKFIRAGLIVLSLIGLLIGLSALFDETLVFKLCGKSCGTTSAMRNLLGDDIARTLISFIWISISGWMGWMAIHLPDSTPSARIEPDGPGEAQELDPRDKDA